jgi:hypothetical protein
MVGLCTGGRREGRKKSTHLSPTGWRAIEEVVGIGGHCAEVEMTDLQELLLLWDLEGGYVSHPLKDTNPSLE